MGQSSQRGVNPQIVNLNDNQLYHNINIDQSGHISHQVKLWVRENHEQFWDADLSSRKGHVPKPRLRMTGEGSIFHSLFTGNGPDDIPGFLRICDDMISHQFNQSDTERLGNYLQLTKTRLRTLLSNVRTAELLKLAVSGVVCRGAGWRGVG